MSSSADNAAVPAVDRTDRAAFTKHSTSTSDIPFALNVGAAWAWRLLLIVLAIGVVVYLGKSVSTIVISVLVAALLAGLLSPAVMWLRKHKVGAGIATAITEVGAIILVVALLGLVGQQLVVGFAQLSDQVVAGYQELMTWLSDGPLHLSVDQMDGAVSSLTQTVKENSSKLATGAAAVGSTAGNLGTGLLICLFTLIFFLMEGERIWLFLVKLFPTKARAAVNGAGRQGWHSLVSYVRIQVFVAFVDAVGIGLGALILGVPLAFPLGVLVFLSSFIPVVGALFSGAIAVLLALVANGPINAIIMLLIVLLVQQIESNILQPLVMGKAVSLHPLAVLLSVALGSMVLGIVGALFAVPALAVVNTVVRYLANRGWESDSAIRVTPFQYSWEVEKAKKKSLKQKAKEKAKEVTSDDDAEGSRSQDADEPHAVSTGRGGEA